MPKGRSYASDNWEEFEKGKQTFIHDDFVHQKALVFKGKLQNKDNGFNLKQTIVERSQGVSQTGQVKFWLSVKDERSLYMKMGTDSKVNLQIDNGVRQLKQIKNNFYFGAQANRTLTEKMAFAGIQLFEDKKWSVNTKLSRDFSKGITFLHDKFSVNWKGFRFNSFSTYDITNVVLTKCGILLGWTPQSDNTWSFSLHFQNPKKPQKLSPSVFLSNTFVNVNKRISDTHTFGLEANFNALGFKNIVSSGFNVFNSLWMGSEWRLGQSVVKARINKDLTSSFVVKNKIGEYGFYSLGVQASEIGSKNRLKFGIQVDLNF